MVCRIAVPDDPQEDVDRREERQHDHQAFEEGACEQLDHCRFFLEHWILSKFCSRPRLDGRAGQFEEITG